MKKQFTPRHQRALPLKETKPYRKSNLIRATGAQKT